MSKEQEHPTKKAKHKEETPLTEAERIEEWRRSEFRRILGPTTPDDDITTLVLSDADLSDARDLAKDGCPPDLIVKILLPL